MKVIPQTIIERDIESEKESGIKDMRLFFYGEEYSEVLNYCIVGEIFADKLNKDFWIEATFHDKDGDIVEKTENYSYYGEMITSNVIKKSCFFNRYPFQIEEQIDKKIKLSKIKLEFCYDTDDEEDDDLNDDVDDDCEPQVSPTDQRKNGIIAETKPLLEAVKTCEYISGYQNRNDMLDFCWEETTSLYCQTTFCELQKFGNVEMISDGLWKGMLPSKEIAYVYMIASTTGAFGNYYRCEYWRETASDKEKLQHDVNKPLFDYLERYSNYTKLRKLYFRALSINMNYFEDKVTYEAYHTWRNSECAVRELMKSLFYRHIAAGDTTSKRISKAKMEAYKIVLKYYPNAEFQYFPEWLSSAGFETEAWSWLDIYLPSEKIAIGLHRLRSYQDTLKSGTEQSLVKRRFYENQRQELCKKNGVIFFDWDPKVEISDENVINCIKDIVENRGKYEGK